MYQKIYNKIINNQQLTEKEIELINDSHKCAVYDFTNCIGHLTLKGKNDMVIGYRYKILKELRENCSCK